MDSQRKPRAGYCSAPTEIRGSSTSWLAETLSDLAPSIAVLHRIGFELVGDGSEPGVIPFEHRTPLGA